jgi:hypothetical protein
MNGVRQIRRNFGPFFPGHAGQGVLKRGTASPFASGESLQQEQSAPAFGQLMDGHGKRLLRLSPSERKRIPGLSKGRYDVILRGPPSWKLP